MASRQEALRRDDGDHSEGRLPPSERGSATSGALGSSGQWDAEWNVPGSRPGVHGRAAFRQSGAGSFQGHLVFGGARDPFSGVTAAGAAGGHGGGRGSRDETLYASAGPVGVGVDRDTVEAWVEGIVEDAFAWVGRELSNFLGLGPPDRAIPRVSGSTQSAGGGAQVAGSGVAEAFAAGSNWGHRGWVANTHLALNGASLAMDASVILSPFSWVPDVGSGFLSLLVGDLSGAGLSGLAMVPYVGGAANVGKAARSASLPQAPEPHRR